MSSLLSVVETLAFGSQKKAVPLLMEFTVNPDTGPFLVSSTKSFVWVNPKTDKVRAAIRAVGDSGLDGLFSAIVQEVASTGQDCNWGNVHPLSPKGLHDAVAHLSEYGLDSVNLIAHTNTDVVVLGSRSESVERADWVPDGWVVVVPSDRDFVGFVLVSNGKFLTIVHNSSRAVAVLR